MPGWKSQVPGPEGRGAAASERLGRVLAGPAVTQPAESGRRQLRRPRAAGRGFRFPDFAATVAPPPARALPPAPGSRLPDGGTGEPQGRHGREQLLQITLQVASSEVTFPSIDLKAVAPDILIVLRSFLCASLFTIVLSQWSCGHHEVRDGPGTYILNICRMSEYFHQFTLC